MATPQGDILIVTTNDGGDVVYDTKTRDLELTEGLQNVAYISLFGGNDQDSGSGYDNPKQYWGNVITTNDSHKLRSRTQYLLKNSPLTLANLTRIEEAVQSDLKWLIDDAIANSIVVAATIPTVNTIRITIAISADGEESQFTFVKNWRQSL